ncbi:MAG: seg [Candidatus Nomurabacteria bacterium]|nr:seg [Candidatus Nomurabacteria bacterium]
MSARLFRSIKKTVFHFPKAVLLSFVFLAIVFLTTTAFADQKTTLDYQYAPYINLFSGTSGLSNPSVQSSTSNNDAIGLTFNLNLTIEPSSGATLKDSWNNVASYKADIFVIKLCLNSDPTQCWLNGLPWTIAQSGGSQNIISEQSSKNNYVSTQSLTVSAFAGAASSSDGSGTNGGDEYSYNPTSKTVVSSKGLLLQKGVPLTATLWYCANGDGASAVGAYNNAKVKTTNPTTFGNLCGGDSYFQIGSSVPVTVPADAATLQQQAAASKQALAGQSSASSSADNNLPKCGVVWGQEGTINGCIAQGMYFAYEAVAWIAGIFGKLFDFFIGYSVSDTSYRYGFAVSGWKLVRDISNIFFIIIMVWTGFSAVFDINNTSMKKVVPALIINAFLINFSLFFTYVVIDISNISARVFYSQMVVCDKVNIDSSGHCDPAQAKRSLGGYWPLSEKIVSAFNPQQIFSTSILTPPNYTSSTNSTQVANFSATNAGNTASIVTERDYANYFGIVCIIAGAIMVAVAIMFFRVTFLFLGRVVGLYICMIFSPFAFLSRDIPMLGKIKQLNWTQWLQELVNYAMLAPIFIFFLYIIYTFLSSDFVAQIGVAKNLSGDFFATVMSVAIPMLIIFFMIKAAQKAAEDYSGSIGKSIQSIGSSVTGLALGAATGGASFLGTNTIGRLANNVADSERFRDWAAKSGRVGKIALKSVDSIGKSSFDARNTTVGKTASKELGINLDQKPLGILGLDTKATKGGYRQDQEDKVKAGEEYKKLLVTKKSDDEIKGTYSEEEIKKRYDYDRKTDKALQIKLGQATLTDDKWKEWKEAKDTKAKYEKAKKALIKTVPPPPVYLTAAERNQARTEAYATHEEKKSGGPFATQDYYRKDRTIYVRKGEVMRNPYADEEVYGSQNDARNGTNPIAKGTKLATKNAWQAFEELGEGAAKGAALGTAVGTVVPGVGNLVGFAVGGGLGAIRGALKYSGVTNKKIASGVRKETKKKDKLLDDLLKEVDNEAGGTDNKSDAAPETPPVAADNNSNPPPTT